MACVTKHRELKLEVSLFSTSQIKIPANMQIMYNMKEKCIWIVTLFFLFVPLLWLIQIFINEGSFDGSFVHSRSASPVFHEDGIIRKRIDKSKNKIKTSHKSILMLNWKEMHKLQHKMVIQNQYKGGYGKEPFKGEQILYQNLYF